jgi:signal transduction histidine kinase
MGEDVMTSGEVRPRSIPRKMALVAAALLATLVALALAWLARQRSMDLPPLSLEELTRSAFDPYMLGYIFQGIVVPAALIYLASTTQTFRAALGGPSSAGFSPPLFGLVVLIQFLVLVYDLERPLLMGGGEPAPATVGLLVVVTAGLLGGWRLGLAVGLVAMLLRGTQQVVLLAWGGVFEEIRLLYADGGVVHLLRYFPWNPIALDFYLYNLWASSAVWAGAVAGLCAELLAERRFQPLAALALGVGIDLGAGYLTAIAGVPPGLMFLLPNLVVSGVAVSVVALMVRSVQAEAARRQAAAAELALAHAELRALRAQINPHFLFNALNTIRYFVRTEPEAARRLLLNLSEVFQRALRSGEFVPLQDELSYVQAYLALEQARLDNRLRVEWLPPLETINESSLREQMVPTLILQPLVENAVVHGVSKKPEGGTVRIRVGRMDGALALQVADDGPGMTAERLAQVLNPDWEGKSIGLRNVDGRLRALYGEAHRLIVDSEVDRGTAVQMRIPLTK